MQEFIEISVTGMHCGGCQQRATQAVTRLHGVLGAMADHGTGVVRVSYDSRKVRPAALVDRLEAAVDGA